MFTNDSQKEAKDKLIILSLVSGFGLPLSNEQITDLVMAGELINYFSLQHYLNELVETSMLAITESDEGHFYSITEMGKVSIEFFTDRIGNDIQKKIQAMIKDRKMSYVMETDVTASYSKTRGDEYSVSLGIIENQLPIIDLNINVVSEKHAEEICSKWKKEAQFLYGDIISLLTSTEQHKD